MGYPVILKATAGGGGRGMRIVKEAKDLKKLGMMLGKNLVLHFGNDGLYLEKFIEEPKHIEIQVVGDSTGRVCHLSERDCSIQRRHQKLVEETPSPIMTDDLRKEWAKLPSKVQAQSSMKVPELSSSWLTRT
jgi:Acetyl/propionyl-CoA carboxylase, alpha subunit